VNAMKRTNLFLSVTLAVMLTGCDSSVVLNSGLTENDANDIISELAHYHIAADKEIDKTGVTLSVSGSDLDRSVRILNASGLPHKARTNLGEMFQKNGIISSPLEERARYIYALSQELESTLSQIDGVVVARVNVVLPERVAPGEPVQPASASVFIKYTDELDPDAIEPRIKQLISSSIPGLAGKPDDAISIVFFPAVPYHDNIETFAFGPVDLTGSEYESAKVALISLLVILVLSSLSLFGFRKFKALKARKASQQTALSLPVQDDSNL